MILGQVLRYEEHLFSMISKWIYVRLFIYNDIPRVLACICLFVSHRITYLPSTLPCHTGEELLNFKTPCLHKSSLRGHKVLAKFVKQQCDCTNKFKIHQYAQPEAIDKVHNYKFNCHEFRWTKAHSENTVDYFSIVGRDLITASN